jgi:small subunit ribosomal protein S2
VDVGGGRGHDGAHHEECGSGSDEPLADWERELLEGAQPGAGTPEGPGVPAAAAEATPEPRFPSAEPAPAMPAGTELPSEAKPAPDATEPHAAVPEPVAASDAETAPTIETVDPATATPDHDTTRGT